MTGPYNSVSFNASSARTVAIAVAGAPEAVPQIGLEALRAALILHVEDGEVRFPAAAWMVAARTPV